MIETLGGKYIVIHGSANLRSSSNIEQFVIEENKELFDFWYSYHERIVEKYKTIKKSLRGGELWQVVAEAPEAEEKEDAVAQQKADGIKANGAKRRSAPRSKNNKEKGA